MKIVLCVALLASTFVVEGKRFAGLGYRSLDKLARSDRYPMPMHRSAAAARNMPGELFSSDVGALDFSGPALDSGAVDGRYWFFSQAAPVLTTHNKGDFLSEKPAGKDRKKKTGKTGKMMRSAVEGNIVSPVGGHQVVTSNLQQTVPEGRGAIKNRPNNGLVGHGNGNRPNNGYRHGNGNRPNNGLFGHGLGGLPTRPNNGYGSLDCGTHCGPQPWG